MDYQSKKKNLQRFVNVSMDTGHHNNLRPYNLKKILHHHRHVHVSLIDISLNMGRLSMDLLGQTLSGFLRYATIRSRRLGLGQLGTAASSIRHPQDN